MNEHGSNLGILINGSGNLAHILGFTRAALETGRKVTLFLMDDGVLLLGDARLRELTATDGVDAAYCDHSREARGVQKDHLPGNITCGSQYNNALMNQNCGRVIVL